MDNYKSIICDNNRNRAVLEQVNFKVELSDKMWQLLRKNTHDAIFILNQKGDVVFSNAVNPNNNNVYTEIKDLIPEKKLFRFYELIKAVLLRGKSRELEFEKVINRGKKYYYCKIVLLKQQVEPQLMVIISDITSRKSVELKLQYMLYHDKLTNLFNRNFIENVLLKADIEKLLPLSIIIADINGLKIINDNYGNDAGDEAIKNTAKVLKTFFRRNDWVSRYGGDEFLVFMPKTDNNGAANLVHRIRKYLEALKVGSSAKFTLGVSTVLSSKQDVNVSIHEAENKMHISKLSATNSYRSVVIESLKTTLLEKDFETREHTHRIEVMAKKMAVKMNLSDELQDELYLIASLHDIGKIGISDNILLKNGKLNEEEWKIIKTHPQMGYTICKTIPELTPVADMVRCHHEWWNGCGYPLGLIGEEIPLLSRITTIIDSFDVMTNKRAYKQPMIKSDAIEELKRCSGTQFDPELVKIFCTIVKE